MGTQLGTHDHQAIMILKIAPFLRQRKLFADTVNVILNAKLSS